MGDSYTCRWRRKKNFQELQKREGMEPWQRIEDTTRGKKTSGQGAESPLVKKKKKKTKTLRPEK